MNLSDDDSIEEAIHELSHKRRRPVRSPVYFRDEDEDETDEEKEPPVFSQKKPRLSANGNKGKGGEQVGEGDLEIQMVHEQPSTTKKAANGAGVKGKQAVNQQKAPLASGFPVSNLNNLETPVIGLQLLQDQEFKMRLDK